MNGPAPRRALGQSGRPADAFVGRRDELAVISSYVDAIVSGSPWVIWVEGDAGSGKTALVRQALSGLSSEVRVLQATADELSADVEFAVVDQLAAIRGRSGFVAGLELLAHIGEAEDSGPVIVVVEDLHWADTASRRAIGLVAENGRWEHAGQRFFDGEVEPCINGRTIETGAYFGAPPGKAGEPRARTDRLRYRLRIARLR